MILLCAVSNLPTKLINFPRIFLYRFPSCMDGGYLSYLLKEILNFVFHFFEIKIFFQCIYGCYVHSAILPTFHRRCYWLLQVVLLLSFLLSFLLFYQNPDIVLVHYLNVPYPDDNKMLVTNSVALWGEKKEWTKEELVSQLKPMCELPHQFP